jgi:nucleoside-triphosphatase THEP1
MNNNKRSFNSINFECKFLSRKKPKEEKKHVVCSVLPPPSKEQEMICDDVKTKNLIITAVPGSGKTTTIFQICQRYPEKRVLILTYNRPLKESCSEKIIELGYDERVHVFTYHALLAVVSGQPCFDNDMFLDLLDKQLCNIDLMYDIIVIDEMQDMRLLHYQFLRNLFNQQEIKDMRMVFVGDPGQKIYSFFPNDPADERYLLNADKLFSKWTEGEFIRRNLTVSFRCNEKVVSFVNKICSSHTKETNMVAGNTTSSPVHFVIDYPGSRSVQNKILGDIIRFGPENVMLLAHSTSYKPMAKIINELSKKSGINFFVSSSFNRVINKQLIRNKVLVQTFCGSKGLERKCVYVFAVSHQEQYLDLNENQLYVALTRSSDKMVIVQNANLKCYYGDPLLLKSDLKQNIAMFYNKSLNPRVVRERPPQETFFVTKLCSYVSVKSLHKVSEMLSHEVIFPAQSIFKQELFADFGNISENISSLIQESIPLMIEHKMTEQNIKVNNLLEPIISSNNNEYNMFISQYGERVINFRKYNESFPESVKNRISILKNKSKLTPQECCELSIYIQSYNQFHHVENQIKHFNWLEEDIFNLQVDQGIEALESLEGKNMTFHQVGRLNLPDGKTIVGYVDVKTDDFIVKFKWSSKLSIDSIIEAAIYMIIHDVSYAYVCNLRSRERIRVTCIPENRIAFLEKVIEIKSEKNSEIDDETFLKNAMEPCSFKNNF